MKLLKIILLGLALLVLALWGLSFRLPEQLEVMQQIELDAKPEVVFKLLENPMEWENWNAVNKAVDPTLIRLYGGPMSGEGARMQWSGDKVGNGEVVFVKSEKPLQLLYKQKDQNFETGIEGSFILESTTSGGTLLYWKQSASINNKPTARLMGLWSKYKKQGELDAGLLRLKTALQNSSAKVLPRKRLARS